MLNTLLHHAAYASLFLGIGAIVVYVLLRVMRVRSAAFSRGAWGTLLAASLFCGTVPVRVPVYETQIVVEESPKLNKVLPDRSPDIALRSMPGSLEVLENSATENLFVENPSVKDEIVVEKIAKKINWSVLPVLVWGCGFLALIIRRGISHLLLLRVYSRTKTPDAE